MGWSDKKRKREPIWFSHSLAPLNANTKSVALVLQDARNVRCCILVVQAVEDAKQNALAGIDIVHNSRKTTVECNVGRACRNGILDTKCLIDMLTEGEQALAVYVENDVSVQDITEGCGRDNRKTVHDITSLCMKYDHLGKCRLCVFQK